LIPKVYARIRQVERNILRNGRLSKMKRTEGANSDRLVGFGRDNGCEGIMDILGTLVGSAKQIAQNAIIDKLEAKSASPDHPLLTMMHDAFRELTPEHRRELFEAFSRIFEHYRSQPTFDFERLWKEITSQAILQEIAVIMSRKLVSTFIRADH
jgi:hypothetical protein